MVPEQAAVLVPEQAAVLVPEQAAVLVPEQAPDPRLCRRRSHRHYYCLRVVQAAGCWC